ncbi:MAG TPA: BTAD domain-containing putative transcriptional regulator, partial [Gemmatimonadaceae bacterium]|nr:BTAD domain-containing putative transcriptional regulator [Gemmatimonadaceae bacterium]
MLRLTTFGALAVHRDGTALGGAASQRRRLALLAVLAASGDRGVPRDKLVTYFWPESDEKHARHSLTQALYSLGRDLRENELVVGTADLRLNAAVMSSDVGDFTAAAATGDDLRAVTLYADPFLDGCHLADAPEFERWADAERARLAATARAALERLATADTRAGDHARAADWWRRLAALEPLDARVAAGYMTALALAGNTTGAIQHARVHETLVRAELDAPPD